MIETTKSFRTSDGVLWSTMREATIHETTHQLTALLERKLPNLNADEGGVCHCIAVAMVADAGPINELLTRYLQECRPVVAAERLPEDPPPGWERIGQSS